MDHRKPEQLAPGDFVRTNLGEGPYRVESIETPSPLTIEIAFVREGCGQRRWFPSQVLRRITMTTDEEAAWTIALLSR